jgi:hypothetical protein
MEYITGGWTGDWYLQPWQPVLSVCLWRVEENGEICAIASKPDDPTWEPAKEVEVVPACAPEMVRGLLSGIQEKKVHRESEGNSGFRPSISSTDDEIPVIALRSSRGGGSVKD